MYSRVNNYASHCSLVFPTHAGAGGLLSVIQGAGGHPRDLNEQVVAVEDGEAGEEAHAVAGQTGKDPSYPCPLTGEGSVFATGQETRQLHRLRCAQPTAYCDGLS